MEITYNNKKYIIGEMVEPNPTKKLELYDIITIFEVVEEDEHGIICPILKPIDYFYKDREDIVQLAKERIDHITRTTTQHLEYRDIYISMFHDEEKYMMVFLNDIGETKSICYDDNFFYVESLLETYYDLILSSFKGWRNRELDQEDLEELKGYLVAFYKWLDNGNKEDGGLDFEVLSDELQELLKGEVNNG